MTHPLRPLAAVRSPTYYRKRHRICDERLEVLLTTLPDRPNTALLVIDVQNGVMANAHNRDGVIANINSLVSKARAEDVPVVWVQHSDDQLPRDSRGLAVRARVSPPRLGASSPQELR